MAGMLGMYVTIHHRDVDMMVVYGRDVRYVCHHHHHHDVDMTVVYGRDVRYVCHHHHHHRDEYMTVVYGRDVRYVCHHHHHDVAMTVCMAGMLGMYVTTTTVAWT